VGGVAGNGPDGGEGGEVPRIWLVLIPQTRQLLYDHGVH
jgi:hypothetical protein